MESPRFARPTFASSSKNHFKTTQQPESPVSPKSLRRSLVFRTIKTLSIKPKDAKKPCPIAGLPAELRLAIYSYLVPEGELYIPRRETMADWKYKITAATVWPPMLRVCRTFRTEFAYQFYSRARFQIWTYPDKAGGLRAIDTTTLQNFIKKLPVLHRKFLARNVRVGIQWPIVKSDMVYRLSKADWDICFRYGNPYEASSHKHRVHLVRFSRLCAWFLWCGKAGLVDLRWNYQFSLESMWIYHPTAYAEHLWYLLMEGLGSFALPCTQSARSRLSKEEKRVIGT